MGGALFRTCGAQDNNIITHKPLVNVDDSPNLSSTTPLKQQRKSIVDSRTSLLKSSLSSPSKLSIGHSTHKHDPDLNPLVNKTSRHDRHLAAIAAIANSTEMISNTYPQMNDEVLSFSQSKQPVLRKGRTLSILSSSVTTETLKDVSPLLNETTTIELNPGNSCSNHPISQPIQIVAINPNFTNPSDVSSNTSGGGTGGGGKIRVVNLTDTEDTLTEDGYVYYGTLNDKFKNFRASLTNSHSFTLSSSINRQSMSSLKRGTTPTPVSAGLTMFVNNHETPDEEGLDFSSISTSSLVSDAENDICNFVPSSSSNSTSGTSDTPLFEPQSSQELPMFNRKSVDLRTSQKSDTVRSSTGKRIPLSKRYGTVTDLNQAIMEEEQHIRSISVTHSLSLKSKLNKLQKEVQTVSQLNHSMNEDASLKSLKDSSNISSKRTTTPNKNNRRKAMTPNPESKRIPMTDEKPMVMSMSLTNLFSNTKSVSCSPEISLSPSLDNPRDSFKKRSMFYNSTQNFWNENHSNDTFKEPSVKKSLDHFNSNVRSSVSMITTGPIRPTLPSIGKKKELPLIIDTLTNRITTSSPTQLSVFKSFNNETPERSTAPTTDTNVGNLEVKIIIESPNESPSLQPNRKAPLTLKQLKKQRLQQLKEKKETEERMMESLMEEQSEINNYLKAIYNHEYYDIS